MIKKLVSSTVLIFLLSLVSANAEMTNNEAVDTSKRINNPFSAIEVEEGVHIITQKSIKTPVSPITTCSKPGTWRSSYPGNADNSLCWVTSGWSACSTTCGEGTRTRLANCVDLNGDPATGCESENQPNLTTSCSVYSDCRYSWSASEWSECTPACGVSQRLRTLTCVDKENNELEDVFCNKVHKPTQTETCDDFNACTYAWKYGEWSACSTTCGTGTKTRSAQCQRSDSAKTIVDDSFCTEAKIVESSCSETTTCANASLTWAVDNSASIYVSNSNGDKLGLIDTYGGFSSVKTIPIQYAEPDENGYIWILADVYNGGGPGGVYLQDGVSKKCFTVHSAPGYIGTGRGDGSWYNGPCWLRMTTGVVRYNWLLKLKVN